jgi:heme iron utilization protein
MSEDAHARPTREAPEPLYDVNIPTPTHAERARTLVARISTGTLCTLALDPEGYPYGSFVTVAFDSGNPIFLISELAELACHADPTGLLDPELGIRVDVGAQVGAPGPDAKR